MPECGQNDLITGMNQLGVRPHTHPGAAQGTSRSAGIADWETEGDVDRSLRAPCAELCQCHDLGVHSAHMA